MEAMRKINKYIYICFIISLYFGTMHVQGVEKVLIWKINFFHEEKLSCYERTSF